MHAGSATEFHHLLMMWSIRQTTKPAGTEMSFRAGATSITLCALFVYQFGHRCFEVALGLVV